MKKMLLDQQRIRRERQQRAWSQTQLAEASGMSLRTVQRIEKDGIASLESTKSLASVFCLQVVDILVEELTLSHPENADVNGQAAHSFLTGKAKLIAASVFILISFVLLGMLWTNLLNGIHVFRDSLFSAELSSGTLSTISTVFCLMISLLSSLVIGLAFDAVKHQGLRLKLKEHFENKPFSLQASLQKIKLNTIKIARFSVKPIAISSLVILLSATGIYLNMEDYQKNRWATIIDSKLG